MGEKKKEKVNVETAVEVLTDAESAFVATSNGVFFHGGASEILTCLSMGVMQLVEQGISQRTIRAAVELGATMGEILSDADKKDEKEEE